MLNPLYIAVSWVLLQWHRLFAAIGLDRDAGITWALSIVMLVVTIRILLFRFFIKQVHSQRKMQEMQPKIQALREKYKNDRQALSQEMMKLQKDEGFNPLSGCLPILLQAPIFLSLFHVLRIVGTSKAPALYNEYGWSVAQAESAGRAKLFGAPIAAAFNTPPEQLSLLLGNTTSIRIVTFILIVLMCAATFITQKQIMSRSGQVLEGQQAMIQKLLLYGMPASLFVSGFFFPLGVLIYWFTNNLFTMGQQFYILHYHPHPNVKKKNEEKDKPAVDPKALAPRPGQKPVNPKRRPAGSGTGSTASDPPAGNAPSPNGSSPSGDAADGRPAGTDGADAGTPASGPATPSGGSPSTPRPARRPPARRSSTTTRPKKKRR